MALYVTKYGEGYGTYDRYFRVNIYEDVSVEPEPIKFDLDGCQIDYRPDAEDFLPGVVPSQCTFGLLVDSATWQTYVALLINTEDRTIYIEVTDVNQVAVWRGWLLVDNIVLEDGVLPYTVNLTAVDGLVDLKNTVWDQQGNELTVVEMLKLAIEKIGTNALYTDDYMITTSVDWYENAMPGRSTNNDPMNLTKINGSVYIQRSIDEANFAQFDVDEDGNAIPMSYYEVLVDLCTAFNARLMMCDGQYQFINPFTAYTAATAKMCYYTKALAMVGALVDLGATVDKTDYARDAGGTDTLLPQAAQVKSVYNHYTGASIFNKPEPTSGYANFEAFGSMIAGTGNYLIFKFTTYGTIVSPINFTVLSQAYVILKIEIKIGSYYLTGDNTLPGSMAWTLTPSAYYYTGPKVNLMVNPLPGGSSPYAFDVIITTPEILADGAASYKLNYSRVTNCNAPFQDVTSWLTTFTNLYFGVNIASILNDEALNSLYYYSDLTAPSTAYKIETTPVLVGDGLNASTPGALQVYTGSAWVYSTGLWRRRDTGTAYELGELRVLELHGLCFKSVYMLQGSIFGGASDKQPLPHLLYDYIDETYVAQLGTLDFDSQTFSGEWYKISEWDIETVSISNKGQTRRLPATQTEVVSLRRFVGNTNYQAAIGRLATAIELTTDEVTEIILDLATYVVFKTGDVIIVMDPTTGHYEEMEVAADQEDTTVTVEAIVVTGALSVDSLVFWRGDYEAYLIRQAGTGTDVSVKALKIAKIAL